ncbi:MAG: thermosome subunit, partial [Candidatus Heimdallarchaeota archaeon]|nr:thermosome subunit [Candidatus Heimdallarchaeota archaeon]MCK5049322.1 thermosome subunit [Candidatus Heimdallarchaeota archaeon]
ITNDGATILKSLDVQHPAAKFLVDLAKTQDDEVGDGTTTVVVMAGELLSKSEGLIDLGVHPSMIVEGFRKAREIALNALDELATEVSFDTHKLLLETVATSMGSKLVSGYKNELAELVIEASKCVVEEKEGKPFIDIDNIKKVKKVGKGLDATELIKGLLIDKNVVHSGMPTSVKDAKIALINQALEIQKTEFDAKINISSPEQIQEFLDQEQGMLKKMSQKIIDAGANVVFAQKGIDDLVQHYLSKAGIMAVRRVKKSDMEAISESTGARICTRLDDLANPDVLGTAGSIEMKKIADDDMLYIEDVPFSKIVTMLIRGGTTNVMEEAERAIHDAICVARNSINDGIIIPGGGAPEIFIAIALRKFADSLPAKQRLAVRAFANSLEIIPRTLAENSGQDPIEIIGELYNAHNDPSRGKTYGYDPVLEKVNDMTTTGTYEPIRVKRQAIDSASEAAQMLLRIDDIIASKGGGEGGMPPGMAGMPPGMGGMPPGMM